MQLDVHVLPWFCSAKNMAEKEHIGAVAMIRFGAHMQIWWVIEGFGKKESTL